jgi:hypothetical protein
MMSVKPSDRCVIDHLREDGLGSHPASVFALS